MHYLKIFTFLLASMLLASCLSNKRMAGPPPTPNATFDEQVLAETKRVEQEKAAKLARKGNKNETREMREARKRVIHREEYEEAVREAPYHAEISVCDPKTVWVKPVAVENPYLLFHSKFIFHNKSGGPVSIRSFRLGMVVKNLCAGGSLSLVEILEPSGLFGSQITVGYEVTSDSDPSKSINSPTVLVTYYGDKKQIQTVGIGPFP